MSHPSISGTLSRLEKKGFIAFRTDEADRRCKRIYILPKGTQCMAQMAKTIAHIEQQVVAGFTPEQREQFSLLLDLAIRNLGGNPFKPFQEEETNE